MQERQETVSVPGLGWSPGVGNGNLLQYSCQKNSMVKGAWMATVHGVSTVRREWAIERTCSWPCAGNRQACRVLSTPSALPTLRHRELYSMSCDKPEWKRIWKKNAHVKRVEKEMATHASVLSWEIPWTEEPGRLQSMESQRARHDWVTK